MRNTLKRLAMSTALALTLVFGVGANAPAAAAVVEPAATELQQEYTLEPIYANVDGKLVRIGWLLVPVDSKKQ